MIVLKIVICIATTVEELLGTEYHNFELFLEFLWVASPEACVFRFVDLSLLSILIHRSLNCLCCFPRVGGGVETVLSN